MGEWSLYIISSTSQHESYQPLHICTLNVIMDVKHNVLVCVCVCVGGGERNSFHHTPPAHSQIVVNSKHIISASCTVEYKYPDNRVVL